MIPAFIADQALRRMKAREAGCGMHAPLLARHRRQARDKVVKPERVLKAEPVSVGTAILALVGVVGPSTALAGTVGFLATTALSIGLSFVSAALSHKGQGPITSDLQSQTPTEQRLSTRQAAPNKRIIYGRAFVGGALFFEECKPPYLYRGYMLCARKINAVRGVQIGNNRLAFASLDPGQIVSPLGLLEQPDYPSKVQISVRLGDPDQAIDPLLARDFPNLDASFRQRGIATVVVRYELTNNTDTNRALWGASGAANTFFIVDGVSVYDPRDPLQNRDDETTWKFSENATLCQADFIRSSYGGRVDPNKIDWDKIAEAADYDDDPIACADGTFIPRYTVSGLLTLNQKPYDVLKSMLTANRGTVATGNGKIWIASAKPRDPALCIYDDLFMDAVQVRNEKLKRDQINILQTRFVVDDRDYTLADGPILKRDDLIAIDGEQLVGTLDLAWTRDYRRVERLQKAFMDSSRLGKAMTTTIDLRALVEAKQELIAENALVASELFQAANGTATIGNVAFVNDFAALQVSLVETDPDIERDWIASRDEKPFTIAALDLS